MPYSFCGGIAFAFTVFFAYSTERQRRENSKLVAKIVRDKSATTTEVKALKMSFTTLETLSRMASVCHRRREATKETFLERMSKVVGIKPIRELVRKSIAIE